MTPRPRTRSGWGAPFAAVVLLALPAAAPAISLVNNLAGAPSTIAPELTVTSSEPGAASSFRTSGNDFTLDSIQVRLRAATVSGATFRVRVLNDSTSNPGRPGSTVIADLGTVTLSQSATLSLETFNASGEALTANTTYWAEVSLASGASSRINLHAGGANSGVGTFPGLGVSLNGAPPVVPPTDIFMNVEVTSAVPSAPEINLSDGADTSAPSIASGGSATPFGSQVANSGSIQRTFTIDNLAGTADLSATSITPSGGNSGDFTVGAIPLPATLTPGSSTTFTVSFAPTGTGTRTTTLEIANNDADESPYTITLSGIGTNPTEPEIALHDGATTSDPEISDGGSATPFGDAVVATGGTTSKTFTISNAAGTADLEIPAGGITFSGANAGEFAASGISLPASVSPGSSTTFTVSFTPSALGSRSATMSIANNDFGETPFTVALSGAGTGIDGVTIVDNFAGAPSTLAPGGELTVTSVSPRAASAFTTDNNLYTLSAVQVRLRAATPSGAVFRARIYADTGSGAPDFGTPVADLGTASLSQSLALSDQTFTASGETLQPSTTYWLEVSLESGASSRIQLHEGGTNSPTAAGTFPATGISLNGGAPANAPNELFMVVAGTANPPQPPVAGPDTAERNAFVSTKIPVADLLSNDSSPAGNTPLTITAVDYTGGNGATLTLTGGTVFYSPNGHNGPDTFTYTLRDSLGLTATGTVTINIAVNDAPSSNLISLTINPDGSVSAVFAGIPGRTYAIETSEDLMTWVQRAVVQATAQGTIPFTDPPTPPPSRFYRTVQAQN